MVDSLVSVAKDRLIKILQDEVALQMGVADEVGGLLSTFTTLEAMLQDAEGRRVNDESVMVWLEKLKDLAYDVDGILDEWRTEDLRSRADEGDASRFSLKKVSTFPSPLTCFNHAVFRHKIGTEIKKAKKRLDDIAKETSQLCLCVDNRARQSMDSAIRTREIGERETSSLIDESKIVGREDDVNKIMDSLVGEGSEGVHEVPTVVSIVGMGGLGKTTLAKLLYNKENVQRHFEMRIWVCVSEDFDVKRVTKLIIETATKRSCDPLALDPMQDRLREMLHGKRFLLVLDDMWSTDGGKWDQLKVPLQAGALGSSVIVTTRSTDVAKAAGSAHVHELSALSDDDCWSLFRHYALRHRNVEEYSELEKIGREIVQKCGGVPLAAKALGSVMCTKGTRREWDIILQSETWSLQCGILPALLLSYYDLPSPLKQCFAYCSLFPKDFVMQSDQLVKLWMAQGFIRSEGSIGMEDIGRQYIDKLLRRSLLQDVQLDDYGNIFSFKIHDYVHDLTQFVAKGDCSLLEEGNTNVDLAKVRHAFLCLGHEDKLREDAGNLANFDALFKAKKLRTAICRDPIPVALIPNLFHHLRLLRALDLSETKLVKLPQAIKKLRCLRYLNLSATKIVELPEAVTDLYNLQTLILNYCYDLCKLPEKMGKLINLRHLELECTDSLEYMPRGIERLTALCTLQKFIVGDGKKECGFGELENLNHLQGELLIERLEKVVHVEEAKAAELDKKQYLNQLILKYQGEEKVNGMLENIRPHSNLKHLTINGYRGYALPKWIEDPSFSNLLEITLDACRKCKQLPCLGKLPSLKCIRIQAMEEVRHVGVEFCGVDDDDDNCGSNGGGVSFPKLEELWFRDMRNWEEWELRGGVVMMPSLLTLKITDCPVLKALPDNIPSQLQSMNLFGVPPFLFDSKLPVFPNLKYLNIAHCDKIKSIQGDWLGELKALDELQFLFCPELECLPEELQHLTMLQTLRIFDCPILEERCKVGGEDWHKIAHIPNVKIS